MPPPHDAASYADYVETRYAPNMIASLLGKALVQEPVDGREINRIKSLYDDIVATDLPSLTPAARTRVIMDGDYAGQFAAGDDPDDVRRWLKSVMRSAQWRTHPEEKAHILDVMPNARFADAVWNFRKNWSRRCSVRSTLTRARPSLNTWSAGQTAKPSSPPAARSWTTN